MLIIIPSQGQTPLQGVSDKEVFFGQSAALTGISKDLGLNMQAGLKAAFNEVNQKGGVAGRKIRLITRDDGYESDQAVHNVRRLIHEDKVFSLVGGVGTPTSKSIVPIVAQTPLLYIGPFTGASFLRSSYQNTVVNVRASYAQETMEMVSRLKRDLKISRIGVLYQNDSYGLDGLDGIEKAVKSIKGIHIVSKGTYLRNTTAVKIALLNLKKGKPQAIIIIGAYSPAAHFIRWAEKVGMRSTLFLSVSFVGVSSLATQLKNSKARVFVTQVVPYPYSKKSPLIHSYQRAMKRAQLKKKINLISLEGYVVGRLVIQALEKVGKNLNHNTFRKAFKEGYNLFDVDGFQLKYDGAQDNQGSDQVFLTQIRHNRVLPAKNLKLARKRN